ncbi:MAG: hypothetical protein JXR25_09315 [Pontiellaceae bacterium]|nr:hypothetical protein [Pontiellaceae bacterium]MBN2785014.1 hypothetical protein [Pontiellaceae bacterium]
MNRWMMAVAAVLMACNGMAQDLDQKWAEAMLTARDQIRKESRDRSENGKRLADEMLRKMLTDYPYRMDWFLQDNGNDWSAWLSQRGDARIEQLLLKNMESQKEHFNGVKRPKGGTDDSGWLEIYAKAAGLRRAQRLEQVRQQFPRIVFTKNHTIRPSFFAYTEGLSDARAERHFTPGGGLCLMEWDGCYATVSDLVADPYGRIRDPDVSFDGNRILFAWKKSDRLDDYHLYEMNVSDGSVRQLTQGLGVADFEPCYAPDGSIIFSSSRCIQTIDCFVTEGSNLYACGPDGEHLRRIGFDQVHTVKPSLLPDGRIVYTRWDYNDRGQVFPQGLFQMNPDGTAQTELYGNNSWFPTTISHARGIPGSSKIVAIGMGHHTWQAGKLMLIDISKGRQENEGVQLIAPVRETPAERVDQYGQNGDLFQYPYPLSEKEFLVAYSPISGREFGIYYMDVDGHRELLVSDPSISCQHPVPLAPRERPTVRPTHVDYARNSGSYYVQDVYHGPGLEGVARGTIKTLRVVALDFRAAWVGSNTSQGPGGGAMASTPISIGNGAWDVKRIIGDAKVYPDGSAFFEVPARTPVYFQCLDENNRALQTMRSWSTLQPAENFSCVGCHEDKNSAPLRRDPSQALMMGAQLLHPFYGESRGFSFPKEIQPILDANCVNCHQKKGKIDLSADPVLDPGAKRNWSRSYLNLTESFPMNGKDSEFRGKDNAGQCVWVSSQSVPEMIPPYSVGSTASPLINMLLKGHGKLNREQLDKFIAWIDLGVPFCGDYYESAAWSDGDRALYDRAMDKRNRLARLDEKNIQALLAGDATPPSFDNPYRNIAPEAEVSANSEYGNLPEFSAGNVIDGRRENRGHGTEFPSWGPDRRDDLWLKLEWDEDVYVDRVALYIRADFQNEHDSWWKSGTIELSNGQKFPFVLKKTADQQVVELPVRQWPPEPVRWMRFADLVPEDDKWCGFTEVDVMGLSVRPYPSVSTGGGIAASETP